MLTFDELRQRFPKSGFAIYAYEPGGPVTLEALDSEAHESFTITQPTLDDILRVLTSQAEPEPPPRKYSVLD